MRTLIDNGNGVTTTVSLEDGALITGTTQDCTPIAERAKEMHNTGCVGSADMRLAASVPAVMVEAYLNRNGLLMSEFCGNPEHIKRLLNDPALAHFRIWKGAL